MVFSSPAFLFLFLPLFFAGYFLVPPRLRSGWILAGSWIYYGWWRIDFLILLILTSVWAWFVGQRIHRLHEHNNMGARWWRTAGVVVPLAVLAYFKYFNFALDSVSLAFQAFGGSAVRLWTVVLPVGISFYTFQIISYVVDVYRRTVPPGRTLVEVAAYVSLFPQLVAGPIVRYKEIAYQFERRDHGWATFSAGVPRFMLGLARKVLIADSVAPIADAVFATPDPSFLSAWLGTLAYAVQIYFDFAAYSDMAIGLGRMMGFRLPENFNMPYRSGSITEFWRRWHMTLSAWLRDYLYIPLGGNRRGQGRTLVNLMTVMVLGGLWHGAAWSFVLWGAWHGVWLIGERLLFRDRASAVGSGVYRVVTIIVVMFSWVLFRAPTLAGAGEIAAAMIGLNGIPLPATVAWQIGNGALVALVAGILICAFEPRILSFLSGAAKPYTVHANGTRDRMKIFLSSGAVLVLFVISMARVMASSYSPFLYFRF